MKLKAIILFLMEKASRVVGYDYMNFRLRRYRLYGAKIGKNVRAFSSISSAESYMLNIGDNVTISRGVNFVTHDNAIIKCSSGTDLVGSINIGNNVFIGINVIILPGVYIADNSIIGAGSVVTKSFYEVGMVIAGNPAKVICRVEEYFKKNEEKVFNFCGLDGKSKKELIMSNKERWLKK